jgi:hypothetical protein
LGGEEGRERKVAVLLELGELGGREASRGEGRGGKRGDAGGWRHVGFEIVKGWEEGIKLLKMEIRNQGLDRRVEIVTE